MDESNRTETRLIAREEARQIILEHISLCPFVGLNVEDRLRKAEISLAKLLGVMIGTGLFGGTAGAGIIKLLSP